MKESKRLNRMRQPTSRRLSESGQATEKADATTDLTTAERPLHDYVAEVSERTDVRVGVPLPPGTYARGKGVNFAFFSRHASRTRLALFDHPEDATASRMIVLGSSAAFAKQYLRDKLLDHKAYIDKHGEDMPEIRNWKWSNPKRMRKS
jgi:hypothetical protein